MVRSSAIGRIFKKDMILLWPVAGLSILTQLGLAALMFAADADPQSQTLLLAARLSVAVVFLSIVFAIALGVQQEPIPGTRQDWLVRPIRRGDLLAAKLLFVLLVVHLPMLAGDLGGTLARGFPLSDALGAALARNLNLLLLFTLPALGFAAMTANAAQFVVAGMLYLVASIAGTIALNLTARLGGQEQATNPLFWTGVAWIPQTAQRMVLAAGAVIALALLYTRRRVMLARGVFPVFAIVSAFAVLAPWPWIFSMQEAATAAPAGPSLKIAFAPQARRYRLAVGETLDDYGVGAAQVQLRGRAAGDIDVEGRVRRANGDVTIFAPLAIEGLPQGAVLWADRATVRLTRADGQVVFQGRGDALKLDPPPAGKPVTLAYEAVRIPALAYEAAKDQPLILEIAYSLSALEPRQGLVGPALGADVRAPGFGRCTTGRDEDGDEIALRCIKPGRGPSCVSAALDDPATGRRNPPTLICSPDYAPYVLRPFPDALSRFEVQTPFRDRLGLAAYPVGAGQLRSARIMVTPYEAAFHARRQLVVRGLRLSQWAAQGSPG